MSTRSAPSTPRRSPRLRAPGSPHESPPNSTKLPLPASAGRSRRRRSPRGGGEGSSPAAATPPTTPVKSTRCRRTASTARDSPRRRSPRLAGSGRSVSRSPSLRDDGSTETEQRLATPPTTPVKSTRSRPRRRIPVSEYKLTPPQDSNESVVTGTCTGDSPAVCPVTSGNGDDDHDNEEKVGTDTRRNDVQPIPSDRDGDTSHGNASTTMNVTRHGLPRPKIVPRSSDAAAVRVTDDASPHARTRPHTTTAAIRTASALAEGPSPDYGRTRSVLAARLQRCDGEPVAGQYIGGVAMLPRVRVPLQYAFMQTLERQRQEELPLELGHGSPMVGPTLVHGGGDAAGTPVQPPVQPQQRARSNSTTSLKSKRFESFVSALSPKRKAAFRGPQASPLHKTATSRSMLHQRRASQPTGRPRSHSASTMHSLTRSASDSRALSSSMLDPLVRRPSPMLKALAAAPCEPDAERLQHVWRLERELDHFVYLVRPLSHQMEPTTALDNDDDEAQATETTSTATSASTTATFVKNEDDEGSQAQHEPTVLKVQTFKKLHDFAAKAFRELLIGSALMELRKRGECYGFVQPLRWCKVQCPFNWPEPCEKGSGAVFMELEHAGVPLSSYCAAPDHLPWDHYLEILFQVLYALHVAQHRYSFVHGDLHAQNVLIKPLASNQEAIIVLDGEEHRMHHVVAQIGDFGLSGIEVSYDDDQQQPLFDTSTSKSWQHYSVCNPECVTVHQGDLANVADFAPFQVDRLAHRSILKRTQERAAVVSVLKGRKVGTPDLWALLHKPLFNDLRAKPNVGKEVLWRAQWERKHNRQLWNRAGSRVKRNRFAKEKQ